MKIEIDLDKDTRTHIYIRMYIYIYIYVHPIQLNWTSPGCAHRIFCSFAVARDDLNKLV